METQKEKNSVSVKIYNENYVLRTAAPEEKVVRIAQTVDARMQKLAETKNVRSLEKLAVWTALDLAAELAELEERYAKLAAAVRER